VQRDASPAVATQNVHFRSGNALLTFFFFFLEKVNAGVYGRNQVFSYWKTLKIGI
jgi:hypothetical protein